MFPGTLTTSPQIWWSSLKIKAPFWIVLKLLQRKPWDFHNICYCIVLIVEVYLWLYKTSTMDLFPKIVTDLVVYYFRWKFFVQTVFAWFFMINNRLVHSAWFMRKKYIKAYYVTHTIMYGWQTTRFDSYILWHETFMVFNFVKHIKPT